MNDLEFDPDFDYGGFGRRLQEAMSPEKPTSFAARTGIPQNTVSKYIRGAGSAGPRLDIVAKMASALGCSLDWLVWGKGGGPEDDADIVRLPRFKATLAAGAGSWNDGRQLVDYMPFNLSFLRDRLGRTSTKGLIVLEAKGDSMFPTIHDSELVVVDEEDQRVVDGIMAFVLDGDARIKRFRKLIDGLTIISDNPSYEPETVTGPALKKLQIIGKPLIGLQVF